MTARLAVYELRVTALLAVLLLLPSAARAQDRPLKAALASYAALSVVDAKQTGACRRAGTCREANPLLRPFAGSPSGLVTVKLAANTGVALTVWKLRKRHPKAALVLGIAAAVSQGIVVASNARQGRQR